MEKWFDAASGSLLAVVISAIGIYVAVIGYTRIFGKRSFSKMSSFDFAMTVAVGSIVATTVVSSSVSLLQGVVGLLSVYLLQLSVAVLRRFTAFQKIVDNKPLLLMKGGKILYQNLKKARVTESDLRSKLRESNVKRWKDIRAVVFETTGDISVLHADDKGELEDWLLQDVRS